jgi:hypothetical protein
MRVLFITFIIGTMIFFSNCKSNKILDKDGYKWQCSILDSVLTSRVLSKTIGLDKAKNTQPYIRFFSEKNKIFANCNSIYFTENKVPVSYFVLPKVSYYMNTGQYRDIIIYSYKENKTEIYISLIAAHYENQLEKEGVPFFEFTFKKNQFGFTFDELKITAIREDPPTPEYYK